MKIITLLLLVTLASCDSSDKQSAVIQSGNTQAVSSEPVVESKNEILDVSKYNVTLNYKPASYIKFGQDDAHYCTLAVLKSSAVKGYKIEITGSTSLDVEIDLTCMQGDNYYSISVNNDTFIAIKVTQVTKDKISYSLNAKLIDNAGQSYFELKDKMISLENEDFQVLIRKSE